MRGDHHAASSACSASRTTHDKSLAYRNRRSSTSASLKVGHLSLPVLKALGIEAQELSPFLFVHGLAELEGHVETDDGEDAGCEGEHLRLLHDFPQHVEELLPRWLLVEWSEGSAFGSTG